jgi:MFS family permease
LVALSALFGFGFAGNMTCLLLCVRQAVPANRFGGAVGTVMFVAWTGMAAGGYLGGKLFDLYLDYALAFWVAGGAGLLNLLVIMVLQRMKGEPSASPESSKCRAAPLSTEPKSSSTARPCKVGSTINSG